MFPLREVKISRCYCERRGPRRSGGFRGSLQGGKEGIGGEADHRKVLQTANLQPTVLLSSIWGDKEQDGNIIEKARQGNVKCILSEHKSMLPELILNLKSRLTHYL